MVPFSSSTQHVLVYSLEQGLVGQCAQLCLHGLTLCLLEMQSTVTRSSSRAFLCFCVYVISVRLSVYVFVSLSVFSLPLISPHRLLPHILYRMGQVAATPSMAIPVLEFLSSIIPLPRLYNGFVEQQYLSVFAIVLNYANTSK